jgi:tRNA pseudouridine55 synthase
MDGFFLIDKQKGESSFDVVRDLRRKIGEKKVGHSGTLDPLATGLLLVAVGEGTKLLEYLIACDKEYEVVAEFGKVSDTFDAEGKIEIVNEEMVVSREELVEVIEQNFFGEIEQVPPKYSALKIKGQRACDIVRKGGEVEMKSRKVQIDEFEIIDFNWPMVSFRVKCGTGTYIRSLIHDLGQKLACGGYVVELRRTRVRDFSVDDASSTLIELEEIAEKFSKMELSDEDFLGLQDGKVLLDKKIEEGEVKMAFYKGKLVGVLKSARDGEGIKFRKMIVRE